MNNPKIKSSGTSMSNDDAQTLHLTLNELKRLQEQAVISAKVNELNALMPEIFTTLKALAKAIDAIPLEIERSRVAMDKEHKRYTDEKFITTNQLTIFETKLETKVSQELLLVSQKINRAGWWLSGVIAAATFFNFLVTNGAIN